MSNHENLIFFNKEGDCLNFKYSTSNNRFEGDILFHENSSDTYKTYGIYTLERVESFDYEQPNVLTTKKFQLFNELGIHFYSGLYSNQQITGIYPVNNDVSFYSKWIYGSNFESKFPIGSIIKFDTDFMEFTNLNMTYVVVQTKKDAIMIISQIDNSTFEASYSSIYENPNSYTNKSISGINAVGIYDYIDSVTYENSLSDWNEPDFHQNLFVNKKLNIVNSQHNDGILTIDNIDLYDITHHEYNLNPNELPIGSDLIIELITKTDLPILYDDYIYVGGDSTISINYLKYPQILKPGVQFKIVGTTLNDIFFTVSNIPRWNGIVNLTYFEIGSQVIYDNVIYQCINAYTQSFALNETIYITPLDTNYWGVPTYIKVDETTTLENIYSGQIYLTTDKYYFQFPWTDSPETTLASAAELYTSDFGLFNIDIYYDDILRVDLQYGSDYATVNYYFDVVGATYSIGSSVEKIERLIGVNSSLIKELNYDISENFEYSIIFTDLDEYGLSIKINGMVYNEEIQWVYIGTMVDMTRTIDKTLRSWLNRHYLNLYALGILAQLQYVGDYYTPFNNSIKFTSYYPNVPMIVEEILVGTTANFLIEHSHILFTNVGNYLNIRINDVDYGVQSITNDIELTLEYWVSEYFDILSQYNIIVTRTNSLLKFWTNNVDRRLNYVITTNSTYIPGNVDYEIFNKRYGNHGLLIASNEVILPGLGDSPSYNFTYSSVDLDFIQAGFATGMIFSINNTLWTWVNQEYNILYLDEGCLNLSYEGPFWGNSDFCISSPFTNIAFSNGFGMTGCTGSIESSISGEFDANMFNGAFNISISPNTYTNNLYDISSYTTNMIDIYYLQLSDTIYVLGEDLLVFDAHTMTYMQSVISTISGAMKLSYNTFNGYLYVLSSSYLYVIDPLTNVLLYPPYLLSGTAYDMTISQSNGECYITFDDMPIVDVYDAFMSFTTISLSGSATRGGKITYNAYNENIYIITDGDILMSVGATIVDINITGLQLDVIFYNELNKSIFVSNGVNIIKIGIDYDIETLSILHSAFNDFITNAITNEINISTANNKFIRVDEYDDIHNKNMTHYGYLALNSFDGSVYMSSQNTNSMVVINPNTGGILYIESIDPTTKIIYNPSRQSIFGIQPSNNSLIEIVVTININIISSGAIYEDVDYNSSYGTLDPNYVPVSYMWLKTRDYIRKPRENYSGDVNVTYYWRWLTDEYPEFFLYDFSGDQLETGSSYSYIGIKPLDTVVLNLLPNRDINRIELPEYQQTVFDRIEHTLPYIDDISDVKSEVEPLQLFIGFKSLEEGALNSTLQLFKSEDINFYIDSNLYTNITLENDLDNNCAYIRLNQTSTEIFTGRGLKPGQMIVIYLSDLTNSLNQYVSLNTASMFKIKHVYSKYIVLDFINSGDFMIDENTVVNDYPSIGGVTYLRLSIKVSDMEIGRFVVYGQTEDEDERFKIELGNIGKLINPDEVFIFNEYDILEGGIDWKILNRKRKEMLMLKHLIYPYIGSYKSIINAINYFGYNDLQLNEYYKNIDVASESFHKLFKIEIPDIFDNTVEGWHETDFIKGTYLNDKYEQTNLFNLTYFITDKEGDNILNYSLDEIIIKLQGLKYWLKRNIIPLTHKILDITGQTYLKNSYYINHNLCDIRIFNINQDMTPITGKLNEAYLMPVNSGSSVYNCLLDFYSIIPNVGKEDEYVEKPLPLNGAELVLPDYYTIKIRSYKVYNEWEPFITYSIGDKIRYYNKLYESVIDNNRINSPRKYASASAWSSASEYKSGTVVVYNRNYYSFTGLNGVNNLPPNVDTINWLLITEWLEIDFEPVQTLNEWRVGDDLLPYNFTVDTNIDPYITIEITSDNGYGEIYCDKKNYILKFSALGELTLNLTDALPKTVNNNYVDPRYIEYGYF